MLVPRVGLRVACGFFLLTGFILGQVDFKLVGTPPTPVVGISYDFTFQYTGGFPPYSAWRSTGTIPPGLTFDIQSGKLSGIPRQAGTFDFGVSITCCGGLGVAGFSRMTVQPPLSIRTAEVLPAASVGVRYLNGVVAQYGARPYTWKLESGTLPPGLTFQWAAGDDDAVGVISGTPAAAGTYTFTCSVTDAYKERVNRTFSLTVSTPSGLLASPGSLSFAGFAGGAPQTQWVGVMDSAHKDLTFAVTMQGETAGSAAPSWLSVSPTSGAVPAGLQVTADPGKLAAGEFKARVVLTPATGAAATVPITLTTVDQSPGLSFAPEALHLKADPSKVRYINSKLQVWNTGGQALDVRALLDPPQRWLSLYPDSVRVGRGETATFTITADAANLPMNLYTSAVRLSSEAGNPIIPVNLLIPDAKPHLELSQYGLMFAAGEGLGTALTQPIQVRNIGPGTLTWTARVMGTGDIFTVTAGGEATSDAPGTITVGVNAKNLPAGYYERMVEVVSPEAINTNSYAVLYLIVMDPKGNVPIDFPTDGLVFIAPKGCPDVKSNMFVFTSSVGDMEYKVKAAASNGLGFINFDLPGGITKTTQPGNLEVIAALTRTANRQAGQQLDKVDMHSYDISWQENATWEWNGLLVTLPQASSVKDCPTSPVVQSVAPKPAAQLAAEGCAPANIAIVVGDPVTFFRKTVGLPVPIRTRVYDECGQPATEATVTATFSNGDPPLTLHLANPARGVFTGTWVPTRAATTATVSLRAALGDMTATAALYGAITAVPAAAAPPIVRQFGVVNSYWPMSGGPLAPGTLAVIRGSGFAKSATFAETVPLPTELEGAAVQIGGKDIPLFSVSPEEIRAQIPFELPPNTTQPVVVRVGDRYSVPQSILVAAAAPAVLADANGVAFALHADGSVVTVNASAKVEEWITLKLTGMGPVSTAVASGDAPAADAVAAVQIAPSVTTGGANASVDSAVLAPGEVGAYLLRVQVPPGTASGEVEVTITQGGVTSNKVRLLVAGS